MRSAAPERAAGALAARGMADAASILARKFVLQLTNVPFLGRGRFCAQLGLYVDSHFPIASGDLSTVLLQRSLSLSADIGTIAAVTKGEWCFLSGATAFRTSFLHNTTLNLIVTFGEEAWEAFGKHGPLATLCCFGPQRPLQGAVHCVIDVTDTDDRLEKIGRLPADPALIIRQSQQLANPDSRITTSIAETSPLLARYSKSLQGISPADASRYARCFWEVSDSTEFVRWQSAPERIRPYGGRELYLKFGDDLRTAFQNGKAYLRGQEAWGRRGIAVRQLRDLACTLYDGDAFDTNVAVIVPTNPDDLPAIWTFCSSPEFSRSVRQIDMKKNVTNATMVKVPFDLMHWQRVAAAKYPNGIPEPYSDDPTQWLFHGHPVFAEPGTELHVALARLVGYRWPAETDREMRLSDETRGPSGRLPRYLRRTLTGCSL
jgi:hypothetical protein